ncbi:MAG: hypothetical protein JWP35_1605 [Caulobacter sp.]|nr:hypothetical protein [Caulobacter sp.]
MPIEPSRSPRFVSFALGAVALSAILAPLLDWSLIAEPYGLFGRLLSAAFLPLLLALPVAALAFRGAGRGIARRAIAPVTVFALAWATHFILGIPQTPGEGGRSVGLALAGGAAVFMATAGLMALILMGTRAMLGVYDRQLASRISSPPRRVLTYPAFAITFTTVALAMTQLWFGAALGPDPTSHLLHQLQLALPPLALGLLAGLSGFHDPTGDKPLGRRIAPSFLAFALVWIARAPFLGGHEGGAKLVALQVGLIGAGLFLLIAGFALYALQGVMRIVAARRATI